MFHQNATSKGSHGLVTKNVFIEFVRSAMCRLMNNERVVIDMLLLVGNHTTITSALGSLAREGEVETVTSDTVVEGMWCACVLCPIAQ